MSTTPQDAPQYGVEKAAVRKVIYSLAALDGSDVDPDDISMIDAANDALQNVSDIARRLEAAEERIDELEGKVPDLGNKDYDTMDRAERVALLRDRMRDRAGENSGHYAADYDDVINILDGGPSAGYAYTLMERAGDADGFEFGKSPNGTKRLTVDI